MRFIPIVLKVVAAVEEQYLSTNILQEGVMERPLLPPNLEAIRLEALKGFYTVNFCSSKVDHPPGKPGSDGRTRVGYWQPSLWPVAEVAQGRSKKLVDGPIHTHGPDNQGGHGKCESGWGGYRGGNTGGLSGNPRCSLNKYFANQAT